MIFRFEDEDDVFHVLRRLVAFAGDTVSMRAGAVIVNGMLVYTSGADDP